MRSIRLRRGTARRLFANSASLALFLLSTHAVFGQIATRKGREPDSGISYPRLPGAVTKAPEGLDTDAPFDIKKSFTILSPSQNAAPLYLDALFEFGANMDICFPPGPATDRRRQATTDRNKRYSEIAELFYKDPKAVSASTMDDVIKLYDTGFRKLAEAQRRERCVFETGLWTTTLLPHVQDARQVARVSQLKIQRAIDRGNLAAAVNAIEPVLRLARDLQPRGAVLSQLVVSAITNVACYEVTTKVLAAPGLRPEHCDRLLRLLTDHEAKLLDGYSEGLRTEYLIARVTMRDLMKHPDTIRAQMGLKPGESVVNALSAQIFGNGRPAGFSPFPADADAQIAKTPPAQVRQTTRDLSQFYGDLLKLNKLPYAARLVKAESIKPAYGSYVLSQLVTLMIPGVPPFIRSESRGAAVLRASECLIAVRHWQLRHRGNPPEMATAIQGSSLKSVPIDPYDGKPMRLTQIDGQPVVYSVGRDGKDDGGRIDSDRDQRPSGDLIFRLPSAQPRR